MKPNIQNTGILTRLAYLNEKAQFDVLSLLPELVVNDSGRDFS